MLNFNLFCFLFVYLYLRTFSYMARNRRTVSNSANNSVPRTDDSESKENDTISKILKWGALFTLASGIFYGGFQFGANYAEIKCEKNNITVIGDLQSKNEELKQKLLQYEMLNTQYATKDELIELKKNMEELSKIRKDEQR